MTPAATAGRYYRLEPAPLKAVCDWVEHYRKIWRTSIDSADSKTDLREGAGVARDVNCASGR